MTDESRPRLNQIASLAMTIENAPEQILDEGKAMAEWMVWALQQQEVPLTVDLLFGLSLGCQAQALAQEGFDAEVPSMLPRVAPSAAMGIAVLARRILEGDIDPRD